MSDKIYPLAYQLVPGQSCTLYYLSFPEKWKQKLFEIARANSPKFKEEYGLPTNALKKLVDSWIEGIVALAPLKKTSDDSKWLASCHSYTQSEIRTLCSLIKVWVKATYVTPKSFPRVKKLATDFCNTMKIEDIEKLHQSAEVYLTLDNGTVCEEAYQAIPLLAVNRLLGKELVLKEQALHLCYAAKNQLISSPIADKQSGHQYSFVFDFSVQTTPPERKALLLCQMSIRRWIPGKSKKEPISYLKENINAHVKISESKFCQVPISYDFQTKKIDWKAQDRECYDIWGYTPLPQCEEVLASPEAYASRVLLPYKNGMWSFKASKIGTGVSVIDKAALYKEISVLLHDIICDQPEAYRIKSKVKKFSCYKSPQEYESPEKFRSWVSKCAETNRIVFEIYGLTKDKNQSMIMSNVQDKIWRDFGKKQPDSCMEIQCLLKEAAAFGDPMENDSKMAKIQRSDEIYNQLGSVNGVTACIYILPGQEHYSKGDPKQAIRNGFARTGRVVQFINPEGEFNQNKIDNAVYDLYRQLGIVALINMEKKLPILANTPCIGMHICTQVHGIVKRTRFLPIYVTVDMTSGKTRVQCDAFEKRTVTYREACLEMAQLFWKKDLDERCVNASRSPAKQELIELKNQYYGENGNVLLTVQSDGNTRAVWAGISDKEIGKYALTDLYCPEQINAGSPYNPYPISLADTGIRVVRIRSNQEVPDYYTMLNNKSTADRLQYTSASGVFQYGNVFWGIHERSGDKQYIKSFKMSRVDAPKQCFAEKDMIEFYPMQLQSGDKPDEWVFYTNALRHVPIQYNQSTVLPLPLHLAKSLEEYLFDA